MRTKKMIDTKIVMTILEMVIILTVLMTACNFKPTKDDFSASLAVSNITSQSMSSDTKSESIMSQNVFSSILNNKSNVTSSGKSSLFTTSSVSKNISSVSISEDQSITPEPGKIVLSAEMSDSGKIINNMFDHYETWYGIGPRGGQLKGLPENGLIKEFPFVKYVTLVTATGGSDYLDLYTDLKDPSKGMKFTDFNAELSSVLYQGVLPYIVLCNVPNALCDDAEAGVMGPNLRPPTTAAQWSLYYEYIKAIAQNCADNFGLDAIRKWQWGCFTEANNSDYFSTSDNNKTNTRNAYFKLYDYTVAALQSVMGKGQFKMGTHLLGHISMQNFSFVAWDELEFIDHCASGKNYYSGDVGTQLDFIAVTHYDNSPGDPTNIRTFTEIADRLRERAVRDGLSIEIAVDDYGQINDQNGVDLTASRTIGLSWGTSKIASDFKELLDSEYSYLCFWALSSSCNDWRKTTNNFLSGARLSQANVAELTYKLAGSNRMKTIKTGRPEYPGNNVNAVISYNDSKNTAYIFVYNHNENVNAVTDEEVIINIDNIVAKSGTSVNVNRYILDSVHSNWFNVWWSERGKTAASFCSRYDPAYPNFMKNISDISYWYENVGRYAKIGEIEDPMKNTMIPSAGNLKIKVKMTHHSVLLYEISNAAISNR
ncbi:MAG: GH39 family glycosyl hydrolase [Saccharofermentanales bacterium]